MLWSVFLIIGGLGLTILLLGVVLDGVLDVFDFGGDGILSVTSIGGAITGLGAGGALAIAAWDADLITSVITGIIVALIVGFIAVKISQTMKKLEQEPIKPESKIGLTGYAISSAKEGSSFEFMVSHAGMKKKKLAIADADVKMGDALIIEAVLGSNHVKVKHPDAKVGTGLDGAKELEDKILRGELEA